MKKVIFACVHNAGRSQMAAAWFNVLSNPQVAVAASAGTEPADRPHPEVVQALAEVDIDISAAEPQFLSESLAQDADWLITMGCGEKCPVVNGVERADWPIEDPKGQSVQRVREIRDDLRARVSAFVESNGWG